MELEKIIKIKQLHPLPLSLSVSASPAVVELLYSSDDEKTYTPNRVWACSGLLTASKFSKNQLRNQP
jgi:hypothetical protein